MVNVVITVPVVGSEMPINDKRVCIAINIRIIAANIVPVYIRHGAYDPPDLVHTDIGVRFSEPLFVVTEIILEHREDLSQTVRPRLITPLYQLPKCLKIEKRFIHLQIGFRNHLPRCFHGARENSILDTGGNFLGSIKSSSKLNSSCYSNFARANIVRYFSSSIAKFW